MIKPSSTGSRTGVGISKDGSTLYIVVVQTGPRQPGMTAKQLAAYLYQLGAYQAINLDNSGSSQLLYYKKTSDSSYTYKTIFGDKDPSNKDVDRPIANFLGFR